MLLHICNDFSHSKVHASLYKELDKLGFSQKIFCPLRQEIKRDNNVFDFQKKDSQILYSRVIKKYYKILFHQKIKTLYKDLLEQIEPKKINMSFATTLFSDGAIALKLWEDFGIPYLVSVRHTDVSLFLKYRPDLIGLAIKIVFNAQQLIFLSPALKNTFFNHSKIGRYYDEWESKVEIIPNGIDEFWLNNISISSPISGSKFIYIGTFERRKNVHTLIKALGDLKQVYPTIELTLIGGGGNKESTVLESVRQNSEWIRFLGVIRDKNKLLEEIRDHDFLAMISLYETFGLVYLEALSQGLPVLYSKGQGIDGLFDSEIGQAVDPLNLEDIKNKLSYLIDNKNKFKVDRIDFGEFKWKNIASTYKDLIIKHSGIHK